MDFTVSPETLALQGSSGALENLALVFVPSLRNIELGRIVCAYPVEFELDAAGNVTLLRELPLFSFSTTGLTLGATLNTPAGSTVSFDFGDGTGLLASTALPHTYSRPGRYVVLVRIADNGRLTEYRAAVLVSHQHAVSPPCIAAPVLQTTVVGGGQETSVKFDLSKLTPGGDYTYFCTFPGHFVLMNGKLIIE